MNDLRKSIVDILEIENNHLYSLTLLIEEIIKSLRKTKTDEEFRMTYSVLLMAKELLESSIGNFENVCKKNQSLPEAH